jgi:hypothetical protein
MKLYMFRAVPQSIIRNLFTVHSATVYIIQVRRQLLSRTRMELLFMWPCIVTNFFIIKPTRCTNFTNLDSFPSWSCLKAVYKPVWHIPLLSVQWINSWWWTDELSEACGVSWQNKFVKSVHLVGFITKKFVTMHGHTNVKYTSLLTPNAFHLRIHPLTIKTEGTNCLCLNQHLMHLLCTSLYITFSYVVLHHLQVASHLTVRFPVHWLAVNTCPNKSLAVKLVLAVNSVTASWCAENQTGKNDTPWRWRQCWYS